MRSRAAFFLLSYDLSPSLCTVRDSERKGGQLKCSPSKDRWGKRGFNLTSFQEFFLCRHLVSFLALLLTHVSLSVRTCLVIQYVWVGKREEMRRRYFSQRNFSSQKILGIFIDKNVLCSVLPSQESEEKEERASLSVPVEIPGITEVTTKYSNKLREKNFSLFEIALRKSSRGDASLLRSAKEAVNQRNRNVLINRDMANTLKYIETRGIIGRVLSVIDEPQEYREELVETVSGLSHIHITTDDLPIDHLVSDIQNVFGRFPPHQTLVVSSRSDLILDCHSKNFLTCSFG